MKIALYLEGAEGRGGMEVFAERQAAKLRAEGHEVVVAGRPEDVPGDCGEIVVHRCRDVRALETFPPEKTVVYIHDHEPICPRTYAYDVWRRNCARPGGVWPCLFCAPVCRDWKGALGRVFAQGRRKRALARVKRIVVISEFMKARLVANGLPEEKIAVETPEVRAAAAARGDTRPPAAVDLLYAGQLIRGKGVQVLLEAMARLDASRTLDVVGAGNMEGRLKAQAARLGLGERVRWRGFVADAREWMVSAACVVVPSVWQEPYGLVAAEAVALGRPVVACDVGGLPEACGGKAILVPPGDAAALAAALEKVK